MLDNHPELLALKKHFVDVQIDAFTKLVDKLNVAYFETKAAKIIATDSPTL